MAGNPVAHGHDLGAAFQSAEFRFDKIDELFRRTVSRWEQILDSFARQLMEWHCWKGGVITDRSVNLYSCLIINKHLALNAKPNAFADVILGRNAFKIFTRRNRDMRVFDNLLGHSGDFYLKQNIASFFEPVIKLHVDLEAHDLCSIRVKW